ncbi:MAG: D-glucuronyl C5-epimerase family protein [Candidatus Nanopelagicales bacterium]
MIRLLPALVAAGMAVAVPAQAAVTPPAGGDHGHVLTPVRPESEGRAFPAGAVGDRGSGEVSGTVSPGRDRHASIARGEFRQSGLVPRDVRAEFLPWHRLAATAPNGPVDGSGVRKFPAADGTLYDHPVVQVQYGLMALEAFRRHRAPRLLRAAMVQADRQIARRTVSRGGWFYSYPFDFVLAARHGFIERTPWYSAMAQGEALSLFSQLAQLPALPLEQRDTYQAAADATFRSLILDPRPPRPWATMIDKSGYLWLQEYPSRPVSASDYTFNGHVFALLGLYDYYRLTGNRLAAQLFDGAATTARHYAHVIRRPGSLSAYCVRHNVFREHYHSIHIELLLQLHWLTGDRAFARLAARFQADHPH